MLQPASKFYFPKRSGLIFWITLLLVSLIYSYPAILFYHPGVVHLWRQCDGLSFATNYYQEGMNFFSPKIHWSGIDGTGAATSEFPIIYYLTAMLWKIFGVHEFLFRLINLTIVFTGLFYFFRFIEDQLKDSFWAIVLTMFLFTSPVFVYYTNNFLMDAPALGCVLSGWYFFGKFYSNGVQRHLYYSMVWFLLAGLLKISSEISFMVIAAIFFIEVVIGYKFKKTEKIFDQPKKQIWPLLLLIAGIAVWYLYAAHYNSIHNPGVFLMNTLPIWKKTSEEISLGLQSFAGGQLVHQFFNIEALILICALFIFQLFVIKKANRFLFFVTVLLLLGVISYMALWFEIVTTHDYYLVMPLIFIAFTLISFFSLLKNNYYSVFNSVVLRICFFLFLGFNVYGAAGKTAVKYFASIPKEKYPPCYSKDDVEFLHWLKDDYRLHKEALREAKNYLKSLGISREDKVISLPDMSTNITLYFMDLKGFSGFDCPNPVTSEWIESKKEAGVKYLIISDPEMYKSEALIPYTRVKLGSYRNLDIYDLTKQVTEIREKRLYDLEDPTLLGNAHTIKEGDAFSGNKSCVLSENDEYGLIIRKPAESIEDYKNITTIELSAKVKMETSPKDLMWVFQISNEKDSILFWKSSSFKYDKLKSGTWQTDTAQCSLGSPRLQKGMSLSVFVWNKDKQKVSIDDIELQLVGYK